MIIESVTIEDWNWAIYMETKKEFIKRIAILNYFPCIDTFRCICSWQLFKLWQEKKFAQNAVADLLYCGLKYHLCSSNPNVEIFPLILRLKCWDISFDPATQMLGYFLWSCDSNIGIFPLILRLKYWDISFDLATQMMRYFLWSCNSNNNIFRLIQQLKW